MQKYILKLLKIITVFKNEGVAKSPRVPEHPSTPFFLRTIRLRLVLWKYLSDNWRRRIWWYSSLIVVKCVHWATKIITLASTYFVSSSRGQDFCGPLFVLVGTSGQLTSYDLLVMERTLFFCIWKFQLLWKNFSPHYSIRFQNERFVFAAFLVSNYGPNYGILLVKSARFFI